MMANGHEPSPEQLTVILALEPMIAKVADVHDTEPIRVRIKVRRRVKMKMKMKMR